MRDAVIVSTARTPIGKAYRGAFNATPSPTLAGHTIAAAVERAKIDPAEVQDVVYGAALQQGVQHTIGRTAALRAGLPVTVAGMSMDRQCSSGLMTIATAAKQVIVDRMDVVVAGGVESISMVQTKDMRVAPDPELVAMHKDIYMPMLQTAEVVAKRYGISRGRMDEYGLQSQQRTAAAQAAGKFDDEIVPMKSTKIVVDKATGETSQQEVFLEKDEGNRPETNLEGLQGLNPVVEGGTITAGNASQLSDGASSCVVMEAELAAKRGLAPLGRYMGMAVAGTEPDEMGIGPVFAVPKLLERFGLHIGPHVALRRVLRDLHRRVVQPVHRRLLARRNLVRVLHVAEHRLRGLLPAAVTAGIAVACAEELHAAWGARNASSDDSLGEQSLAGAVGSRRL